MGLHPNIRILERVQFNIIKQRSRIGRVGTRLLHKTHFIANIGPHVLACYNTFVLCLLNASNSWLYWCHQHGLGSSKEGVMKVSSHKIRIRNLFTNQLALCIYELFNHFIEVHYKLHARSTIILLFIMNVVHHLIHELVFSFDVGVCIRLIFAFEIN